MNKNCANKSSDKVDLYTLLNVPRDADRDAIKKAYKVLALKVHPDKNPDDQEASEKFTNLHNAYNILIDEEKRRLYDTTGEIDDSFQIDLQGTYDFYKNVYPTITVNDIESFSLKYRDSEDEKEDLMSFYKEQNGDMTKLLEYIPLSTNDDIDRFLDIYEELFKQKILKKNKKFTATKNKIAILHEDDPEEVQKEKDKFDDLCKQIMAKKSQRGNFLDHLSKIFYYEANKFCADEGYEDIDEENFQKAAKKIRKKK